MTQLATSKAASPNGRARPARTPPVSLILTGDAAALKELELPDGVRMKRLPAAPTLKAVKSSAFTPDARALALLEGVRTSERILEASGGAFELKDVMLLLNGISRQAVDKRVQEKTLLAVPGPANRRRYPTLQFADDRQVVEGMKPVLEALPTDNPWVALSFLALPNDQLGDRLPIDLLKSGNIDMVVRAARNLAEPGA